MPGAHRFVDRLAAVLLLGMALAGCASTSSLDALSGTTPTGSPFTQALFKNYSYLANSFGTTSDGGFDTEGVATIFDSGSPTDSLAEAFATKALIAARGSESDPEPSIDGDSERARARLTAALAEKKDRYPGDAALAQAEFDCWMLNSAVGSQQAAAGQCRAGFERAVARLEADGRRMSVAAPPPATPPPSDYTVYFDLNSWSLSGEQLTTLQSAIAVARAGGQSRITVVGHTDTSGTARYNEKLSLKRANVVTEALVDLGARREAIQVSGVGEKDLAVQTADGVKEPRNRRTVITLLP
jgi:OOP family OmpA-OmpF porin